MHHYHAKGDDALLYFAPLVAARADIADTLVAMKDGRPFGIGGLWENRKEPTSGEGIGTRCVARSCAPNKPRQLSLSSNKQRANKHLAGKDRGRCTICLRCIVN